MSQNLLRIFDINYDTKYNFTQYRKETYFKPKLQITRFVIFNERIKVSSLLIFNTSLYKVT